MELLAEFLDSERAEIMANAIRLHAIGELERLPGFVRERLARPRRDGRQRRERSPWRSPTTRGRSRRRRPARAAAGVDPAPSPSSRPTSGPPGSPSSTSSSGRAASGGSRTSSCGSAPYAELAFSDVLWPDFRDLELLLALGDYQARERRFGLTGAQLAARGTDPE